MAKREDVQPRRSPHQVPAPAPWPAWAALGGVAVLLVLTIAGWSRAKAERQSLEARLANLDAAVAQASARVEQLAKAARPPRNGPDPDKVYTIRTDNAPSRGRVGAPIVIAEFSDF